MAITFPDTGTRAAVFGTTNTLTAFAASSAAQWLYVCVYADTQNANTTITGVTFNSNALTLVGSSDDGGTYGRPVVVYRYDLSASGATTADIVVTVDVAAVTQMAVFTVAGTNVTQRATSTFLTGAVASFNPSVTSNTGDVVVGFVGWDGDRLESAITKVNGQTLIVSRYETTGIVGAYQLAGSASSTSMEWTVAVADDGGAGSISLYEAVAGATITASDATATRGQTDYNFTLSGGDASPGTATLSDGTNTAPITITTYNPNGVCTATIPSDIAIMYDTAAVLTFTDAASGTPTANVDFQPEAGFSYRNVTDVTNVGTSASILFGYTGAAPTTGMQIKFNPLTNVTSKVFDVKDTTAWSVTPAVTQTETVQIQAISTDGSQGSVQTFTLNVGGGGSYLYSGGFGINKLIKKRRYH